MEALHNQAAHLIKKSIAPSTEKKYNQRVVVFHDFCKHTAINPFPLTENTLILFATSLSSHKSYKNINGHLAAVKFHAQVLGHDLDITPFSRLYRLLRGIKRTQGSKYKKPPRIPITPPLLLTLGQNLWNSSYHHRDKAMVWAAMTTAFYGFLRVSEYTTPLIRYYDQATTLCFDDVQFVSPSHVTIHIKASKTDPFRAGVSISLHANNTALCPVHALEKFMGQHHSRSGPLFVWNDGRFLTRSGMAAALNRMKPAYITNMSTHSFRIGAASTAAAAGYPRWLIQALGRWSSNCYQDYIRISDTTLSNVSMSLASQSALTQCPVFDPDNIAAK